MKPLTSEKFLPFKFIFGENYLYKKESASVRGLKVGIAQIVVANDEEYAMYVKLALRKSETIKGRKINFVTGNQVPLLTSWQFICMNKIMDYYFLNLLSRSMKLRDWLASVQTGSMNIKELIGINAEDFNAIRKALGFTCIKPDNNTDIGREWCFTGEMKISWENCENSCKKEGCLTHSTLYLQLLLALHGLKYEDLMNPQLKS